MESERLVSRFARIGARSKVQERAGRERGEAAANVAVDVQRDRPKPKTEDRESGKIGALVQQGEWRFVPEPGLTVVDWMISRNKLLSRGAGRKPHIAEFCYRAGGEVVHVCEQYPHGLDEAAYARLLESKPEAQNWVWRLMRCNPHVYVKGQISHEDHETIVLRDWHRVLIDTEKESWPMWSVVFLD